MSPKQAMVWDAIKSLAADNDEITPKMVAVYCGVRVTSRISECLTYLEKNGYIKREYFSWHHVNITIL